MHKIAILASGSGTNAENIAREFASSPHAKVSLLVTNRPDAGAIARLTPLGVPVEVFSNPIWADSPELILAKMEEHGIDFVVLAGFLRKIHPKIVERYAGKMVNIHPSLLPRFGGKGMYGMNVHRAVVEAGVRETGATVHYVTDGMDEGEIIMQRSVDVEPSDTPETVASKVHEVEMQLYPAALKIALEKC